MMTADRLWRFRRRADGGEEIKALWLYPELDCSSCIDDVYEQSGEAQLAYYIDYVRRGYPQCWDNDAVPIMWSVRGDGISEYAPVEHGDAALWDEHFLTFYTPPEDAKTGELLNWWRLPVRNTRFPQFAKALGWLPAPFQSFAPLRSIYTNRTASSFSPRERA